MKFPITIHKDNSKWIKDLHVRRETIKLLGENTGRTFFDINYGKIFFDPPPRVMKIKTKINIIKHKSFGAAKEIIFIFERTLSLLDQKSYVIMRYCGCCCCQLKDLELNLF